MSRYSTKKQIVRIHDTVSSSGSMPNAASAAMPSLYKQLHGVQPSMVVTSIQWLIESSLKRYAKGEVNSIHLKFDLALQDAGARDSASTTANSMFGKNSSTMYSATSPLKIPAHRTPEGWPGLDDAAAVAALSRGDVRFPEIPGNVRIMCAGRLCVSMSPASFPAGGLESRFTWPG